MIHENGVECNVFISFRLKVHYNIGILLLRDINASRTLSLWRKRDKRRGKIFLSHLKEH
jgi:hypothetical protein